MTAPNGRPVVACPLCDGELYQTADGYRACRACGAYSDLSPVSGQIIWKRNGRVMLAQVDTDKAIRRAAADNPDSFAAAAEHDPTIAAALKGT